MRARYNPQAKSVLNTSDFVLHKGLLKLHGEETVEIGMGNGEMLVQMASANPGTKFVGVEQSVTFAAQAIRLASSAKLKNLTVFSVDAFFLPLYTTGFFRKIYLAFPDPWPKSKHVKRRLTSPSFITLYKRLLVPGGLVFFKSDVAEMCAYSQKQMAVSGFTILHHKKNLHHAPCACQNFLSAYERKKVREGKQIHHFVARYDNG